VSVMFVDAQNDKGFVLDQQARVMLHSGKNH